MARTVNGMLASVGAKMVTTWRKEFGVSPAIPTWKSLQGINNYNSYWGRLTRYSLYWAMYENTAYDDHLFSNSFKSEKGLYRHTRGVTNPLHRLVEMWATMTWNGGLDIKAGDGKSEPTSIPILTENEDLRPAIAKLWKDSQWAANKNMVPRLGGCLGDVAIRIADDAAAEAVRMEVIHPGTIRWLSRDVWGNVKAYLLEEWRIDPEYEGEQIASGLDPTVSVPVCLYSEQCVREDGYVVIRTFRNGQPYDWDGSGWERYLDFGFVPLVIINHKKMGPRDQWGWAEVHAGMTKAVESDDLASKLDDQIRKVVEGAWFVTNAYHASRRGQDDKKDDKDDLTPSRQDMKIIYGGQGGTAVPLLFPLDIQFTTLHLDFLRKLFEKDYPELEFDSLRVSGDASAKALREVRKKAVTKFNDGRVVYDEGLVKAQQMAIAIGGYYGYPGYEKFNLDSFKAGKLDHRIAARPVFEVDTLDRLEEEQAFWNAASTATGAGCPLVTFLRENGWPQSKIDAFLADQKTEDAREMAKTQAAAQAKATATGKSDTEGSDTGDTSNL